MSWIATVAHPHCQPGWTYGSLRGMLRAAPSYGLQAQTEQKRRKLAGLLTRLSDCGCHVTSHLTLLSPCFPTMTDCALKPGARTNPSSSKLFCFPQGIWSQQHENSKHNTGEVHVCTHSETSVNDTNISAQVSAKSPTSPPLHPHRTQGS